MNCDDSSVLSDPLIVDLCDYPKVLIFVSWAFILVYLIFVCVVSCYKPHKKIPNSKRMMSVSLLYLFSILFAFNPVSFIFRMIAYLFDMFAMRVPKKEKVKIIDKPVSMLKIIGLIAIFINPITLVVFAVVLVIYRGVRKCKGFKNDDILAILKQLDFKSYFKLALIAIFIVATAWLMVLIFIMPAIVSYWFFLAFSFVHVFSNYVKNIDEKIGNGDVFSPEYEWIWYGMEVAIAAIIIPIYYTHTAYGTYTVYMLSALPILVRHTWVISKAEWGKDKLDDDVEKRNSEVVEDEKNNVIEIFSEKIITGYIISCGCFTTVFLLILALMYAFSGIEMFTINKLNFF